MAGLSALALAACGEQTITNPTVATPGTATTPELAVASNTWIARAHMPTNRSELVAATLTNAAGQSEVYAIGGFHLGYGDLMSQVTVYNVATNTWTFRRPLPVELAQSNGATVINGKIYVSGGYLGGGDPDLQPLVSSALYVYDPSTNRWSRKSDMPTIPTRYGREEWWYPGAGGVSGVIQGKLYVVTACFGSYSGVGYDEGCADESTYFDALFFAYNPVTDRWTVLPRPFDGLGVRSPYVGGVLNGKFYVAKGTRVRVYDPATNKWSSKPTLTTPLGNYGAVMLSKLYTISGTQFRVYDPATNSVTTLAALPSDRGWAAAAKVVLNGQPRLEVLGGEGPGNNLQYIP
jgi:hypothetical protein